jgi:hypothetical protein
LTIVDIRADKVKRARQAALPAIADALAGHIVRVDAQIAPSEGLFARLLQRGTFHERLSRAGFADHLKSR